jgi:hypothetical protein
MGNAGSKMKQKSVPGKAPPEQVLSDGLHVARVHDCANLRRTDLLA